MKSVDSKRSFKGKKKNPCLWNNEVRIFPYYFWMLGREDINFFDMLKASAQAHLFEITFLQADIFYIPTYILSEVKFRSKKEKKEKLYFEKYDLAGRKGRIQ